MAIAGKIVMNVGDKPTAPDTGKIAMYVRSNDKIYYQTSDGTEYWITASGVAPTNFSLLDLTDTPSIYEEGKILQSTSSGTEWVAGGGGGTTYHNLLENLDFVSSNHTGFASSADLTTVSGNIVAQIPTDFYTQAEVTTISGNIVSQIPTDYYTTGEVDTISGSLRSSIDGLDYYTTSEVDGKITTASGALQSEIDTKYDKTGGTISGNVVIEGNLTVTGTEFIQHVETVEIDDNLLLINANETGGGVTRGWAGIEVDRGTETNYQFMFVEADDNFQVGISGSTQPVATRMDSADMDDGYVTYWDAANYRLITTSGIAVSDIASTALVATTSGTLQDAIDNLSSDKISEGDSSVEVVDAGTGYVSTVIDGTEEVRIADNSYKFGTAISNSAGFNFELGSSRSRFGAITNSDSFYSQLQLVRSKGSAGSETTVTDGDAIGAVGFGAYDGNSYEYSAGIYCYVDGAVSDEVVPMEFVFETSETESSGRAARLTIKANGTLEVAKNIQIDETPSSDHTATGTIANMTVGESVVFGNTLYMKSDGKLWKSDASDEDTMPVMAMAVATISADASGSVLLQGFVRDDTWTNTVGGIIYVSETAGAITQTAPTTSESMVQAVGIATHADRIFFNPSYTMGEIA